MDYEALTADQQLAITKSQLVRLEQQRYVAASQVDSLDAQITVLRSTRDALVKAGASDEGISVSAGDARRAARGTP